MNISASNQSLENIIIRQEKEKKRPSFASVFEKINKRTSNMNRLTPLNNKLTNEQLFRYYLKETDPKLRVSDDAFGEDETTLADLITNKSLNKSKVNQTIQTDDGDDDGGKDDASKQQPNVDEYFRIVDELNGEQQQDKSQSFVDHNSFFPADNYQRIKDAASEASKQFLKNLELEQTFNEMEGTSFNKKTAAQRHAGDLLYEIAINNSELGFVNEEYRDSINPVYEGDTNDFLPSIVGNTPNSSAKKTMKLQNALMEAGADEISPIKPSRTITPVKPKKLVEQLVGAKSYTEFVTKLQTNSKQFGPEKIDATWQEIRDHTANELYYLQRGKSRPLDFNNLNYYVREDPLWRPTDGKTWSKYKKYDKDDWNDSTLHDRASTAIQSAVKGHAVRKMRGTVNDLVNDLVTDAVSKGKVMNKKNVINPNTGRSVAIDGALGKKLINASSTIQKAIKMKIARNSFERTKTEGFV